ncbi:hypothetical protein [Bacillus amyloliquefaciens]|uniref:hypothetical protein n=1 Tax=Bacillus amyloliquefaciens TaxID=1390 RepID=UPI00200C6B3E|nr:hypothetical protein [Bacillus amyloliquefaciens]
MWREDLAQKKRSANTDSVKGSYAIALFDGENTDTIYVAKNKSPLLIGLGDTFNVVASDAMAMLQVTNEYVELLDKEMVIVTKDEAVIKNLDGEVMTRASYIAELDASDIEKGTYPHYMLKETDEQPLVMRKNHPNVSGRKRQTGRGRRCR